MSKLKAVLGLGLVMGPEWISRLAFAGRVKTADGRAADPKAQAVGELVNLLRDPNAMPDVAQSRAQLQAMADRLEAPCPASVSKRNITLPGAEGDRPARVYTPQGMDNATPQATLLYLHGGGWIQGSIDTHDGLCGLLAQGAGIKVISYDYRLAPEHPFPAAPNDVLACYRGLIDQAEVLGIDPNRLAVGGDSAGGNLAAALLHDIGGSDLPMPAAQLLLYPGVDGRLNSASMKSLRDAYVLSADRIDWYIDLYLSQGEDRSNPRMSPLMSDRLGGQPTAMIVIGGHDPLWDDGHNYAAALRQAGVAVELLEYPGQIHAFMSMTKVMPQGLDAVHRAADWLKSALS